MKIRYNNVIIIKTTSDYLVGKRIQMENILLEEKKVFISYSHKDVTEEWIKKLATALANNGIEPIVDNYDLVFGQDINHFMEQIKIADKVLMLLGKNYKEKADYREGGVGVETQIISGDVYKNVEQTRFIPIVIEKNENGNAYLPTYLETRLYMDFTNEKNFKKNIKNLVKQIYDLPIKEKPKVKKSKKVLTQEENDFISKKKSL